MTTRDTLPTLVDFLRARLDEDEQVAHEAAAESGPRWHSGAPAHDPHAEDYEHSSAAVIDDQGRTVVYDDGRPSKAQSVHIARHDPARVLRGIEAKRELVARYEAMEAGALTVIGAEAAMSEYRRVILPQLALTYAGHPDYREEWRGFVVLGNTQSVVCTPCIRV